MTASVPVNYTATARFLAFTNWWGECTVIQWPFLANIIVQKALTLLQALHSGTLPPNCRNWLYCLLKGHSMSLCISLMKLPF